MKIIDLKTVSEKVGLSTTTITRREKVGKFPNRVQISERRIGWLESDINTWLNQHIKTINKVPHANK